MDRRSLLLQGCAFSFGAACAGLAHSAVTVRREVVIGGACEGCDWVYDDPPATLTSRARIAPRDEPGVPLVIEGEVRTARGHPAGNVIIYAYHTDQAGLYPHAGNRHGRLRGWAQTDARGRYRFETIRPGAYPQRDVAEHVHMHVIEPGVGTYYIDNLEFEDDPLNSRRRGEERGGNGLTLPLRRDGVWHARRDVALGHNIPGYPIR